MRDFYHKRWVHIVLLVFAYLLILFFFKRDIFAYSFDQRLISRYFLSQDIIYEVPGVRLFLSDSDIYIATGYLYAKGIDPTLYNFQAPPLLKYLFGYSILLFGNPYYMQILLGVGLLIMMYLIGLKLYKAPFVALLACVLLLIDPVFLEVSSNILLDLGQSYFLLLYVYLTLWHKDKYLWQGVVLGLLCATKFWAGPLFFVVLLSLYNIYKKNIEFKKFILHIIAAFVIFSLIYIKAFLNRGFVFNIVFFQLKILKFLLVHDIRSFPFASLLLFTTGFYQTWWGTKTMAHSQTWSLMWPVGLIVGMKNIYSAVLKRLINEKILVGVIPLLYLLYLGVQAPFTRYFILILPFLYLNLASKVVKK